MLSVGLLVQLGLKAANRDSQSQDLRLLIMRRSDESASLERHKDGLG